MEQCMAWLTVLNALAGAAGVPLGGFWVRASLGGRRGRVGGSVGEGEAEISDGEAGRARFCMLAQLLTFAALGLLLANSLVQVFVFWQLGAVAAYFMMDRRVVGQRERAKAGGLEMWVI